MGPLLERKEGQMVTQYSSELRPYKGWLHIGHRVHCHLGQCLFWGHYETKAQVVTDATGTSVL